MVQQVPVDPRARADREQDEDGPHGFGPDLAYRRLVMVNVVFVGAPGAGDRGWVLVDAGIPGREGSIKRRRRGALRSRCPSQRRSS